jgi:DNA invertase Pin-like site-specific DNA recombinase
MKIGYARVSTAEQNLDRQLDGLTDCERVYQEKITGTKADRPELQRMIESLRPGDTVIVSELTRLSRSTKDLFQIVDRILAAGANLKSIKDAWLDTESSTGKLIFTIMAGISQFERDLISDRTKDGLTAARARGRKGGRPMKDSRKIETALKMYDSRDHSLTEITKATGISKATLYRRVNARRATGGIK